MESIGATIRRLRKLAGMSQMNLGEKVGVSYQQIQKYENGSSAANVFRLQQIADALNVPIGAFLDEELAKAVRLTTSHLKPDEIKALELFRRIKRPKLRKSLIQMTEDLVRVAEGKQ